MAAERAKEVAQILSEGRWTHDFPIDVDHALQLGLPVSRDLPDEVRLLMSLYPQPRGRRPSVEYIPTPHFDRDGTSTPGRRARRAPFGTRA
jgi:hypothetical protein